MNDLTIRGTRAQQNLMEWSRRVEECRTSGQSVRNWCEENNINPKTNYNWQKKVFAAMIEQQNRTERPSEETGSKFAELPMPTVQNALVAKVRIGSASPDVYSGASTEVVSALCKALKNAK